MFLSFDFKLWSSKLAMKVENLEKWRFIPSWKLKEQKFEQETTSSLTHLSSYYSSYFQASPHLELKPNPCKHLCVLIENFKLYGQEGTTRISKASHIHWSNF